MEQLSKNEHAQENKQPYTVDQTSNAEYYIIDTGIKKRYIPKREKILVNGVLIKTKKLIAALGLYPDCEPGEALERLAVEHPEIK